MSYKSKRSRATDIPPKVKALVYERDNKCCVICGRPGSPNMHYISRNNRGLGIERCYWMYRMSHSVRQWLKKGRNRQQDKEISSVDLRRFLERR